MKLFYNRQSGQKKLTFPLTGACAMLLTLPGACAVLLMLLVTMQDTARASAASANDVHEVAEICMLSNRLLKDYSLIGMGVEYHDPAADLKHGAQTIDDFLVELESHHLAAELDAEILELDHAWKKIEPLLLETPHKDTLPDLRKQVERFTKQCEKVAEHLAVDSHIEGEHDVVLIAELGMEVQRLAALYMLKAWGADEPNYFAEVEEIKEEFQKIYHELEATSDELVPPEVKAALKTIDDHFLVFTFMANSKSGRYMPARAEKIASEVFVEIMEILKLEEDFVE